MNNKGNICGTYTSPLILPPQVCIVGIGKTQKLPRYIEDENGKTKLKPRSIVNNHLLKTFYLTFCRCLQVSEEIIECSMDPLLLDSW